MNEVIDLISCLIGTVEQHLVLLVQPSVGQILNPYVSPLVLNLATAAIDHSRYFIRHDELQIFGRERVADEQAILDLYGSDYVVIHQALIVHFLSISLFKFI